MGYFGQIAGITLLVILTACSNHEHDYLVFVGTYTHEKSEGIYAYRFNSINGDLLPIGLAAKVDNPSYLITDATGNFLYTVSETDSFGGVGTGAIHVFAIHRLSGALELRQQLSSEGAAPCHLSLDHTGKYLFVANYMGGSIAAFRVGEDGRLEPHHQVIQGGPGSGVNALRQSQAHAHYVHASPDNRYVLGVDLGRDLVLGWKLRDGYLDTVSTLSPGPGSGPRHLAFAPAGDNVYVVNELTSEVAQVSFDAETGAMQLRSTISALPTDYIGNNTGAAISTVNGKHLYVSNRGHNSIGQFLINPIDGHLTALEWFPSGGQTPRHFEIDPTGRWMIVANQDSNNLVLFSISTPNGRLLPHGKPQELAMPVCVRFVPIH